MFKKVSSGVAALGLMAAQAHAALPAGVTTAIEDAGTDGITAAGLVLVAIIGIYAVKLVRRAL